MENESLKKENELEEGEINIETEMDEISEENEIGEVEIDERVKDKKEVRKSQAKTYFLIRQ